MPHSHGIPQAHLSCSSPGTGFSSSYCLMVSRADSLQTQEPEGSILLLEQGLPRSQHGRRRLLLFIKDFLACGTKVMVRQSLAHAGIPLEQAHVPNSTSTGRLLKKVYRRSLQPRWLPRPRSRHVRIAAILLRRHMLPPSFALMLNLTLNKAS
jgi:hypothetical protein